MDYCISTVPQGLGQVLVMQSMHVPMLHPPLILVSSVAVVKLFTSRLLRFSFFFMITKVSMVLVKLAMSVFLDLLSRGESATHDMKKFTESEPVS